MLCLRSFKLYIEVVIVLLKTKNKQKRIIIDYDGFFYESVHQNDRQEENLTQLCFQHVEQFVL